nr:Hpt domain-containing protein [Clostridia bacterium]
ELRIDKKNKNLYTPSICLTANAVAGAKEQYLNNGFDDYMTKPIDANMLEKKIMHYLPKEKLEIITDSNDLECEDTSIILPEWLYEVENLNIEKGISLCGSEESYLETLMIYGSNAMNSVEEIESLWKSHDLPNTTIKIHAVKSLSRTIGASKIGALAEKLEFAGKAGDAEAIEAELDDLLNQIRALCEALDPLFEEEIGEDEELPVLSDEEMQDAYEGLLMASESLDTESAEYVFDYLSEYTIPEEEKETFEKIKTAIKGFNWEEAISLLKNRER